MKGRIVRWGNKKKKNLEYINVDVIEILRFALNDNQGEYLVLITSNVPRRSQ